MGLLVSTVTNYALLDLAPSFGTILVLIGMMAGAICAFATGSYMAQVNRFRIGLYSASLVVVVWALILILITPTQEVVTPY